MMVEDTYIAVPRDESSSTAAYVWHCRVHPRVYSAVSLQCGSDLVEEDFPTHDADGVLQMNASNFTTNNTHENYQVHDIHRQCVLNIHVGRGAHLLIYVVSAVLFIGACGVYLCCMWACCVCCNCRTWPCIRWLPFFRDSHNSISRSRHRAMRDMGPDGGGSGVHIAGAVDSAWELPSAKPAGFKSTFARLARAGGIGGGGGGRGGSRGAKMV
jgi:hypothetical protein